MKKSYMEIEFNYPVTIKKSNGEFDHKIISKKEFVLCEVWQEECHGYHTMIEPIESEQNRLWDEFYSELTLDKINNEYNDIFNLDDEVKAVEILGVE